MSKENLIINYKGFKIGINPENYYFADNIHNNPSDWIKVPAFAAGLAATVYCLGSMINSATDHCFDMKYSKARHAAIVVASGIVTARAIDIKSIDQAKIAHDGFLFAASLFGQAAKYAIGDELICNNSLVWQAVENVVEITLTSASSFFEQTSEYAAD